MTTTSRASLEPRVLVLVQDSSRSIKTTGHLEAWSLRTVRCWTVADVQRALKEFGGALGAAVIDVSSEDGSAAAGMVRAAIPSLPVLVRAEVEGRDTYA